MEGTLEERASEQAKAAWRETMKRIAADNYLRQASEHERAQKIDQPLYFDYTLQVWLKNGIVVNCGHPLHMGLDCCNGRRYQGMDLHTATFVHSRKDSGKGGTK